MKVGRIRVLKPIRFEALRRNELENKIPAASVSQRSRAFYSASIHKPASGIQPSFRHCK